VPPTISLRKLRSETARINEAVNANAAVFNEQVLPLLETHEAALGRHNERLLNLEARIPLPDGAWARLRWLVTGRG
jgi:hypothetical protein